MTRHDLPPPAFVATVARNWAVAPEQGWLQGPLDLAFFPGQRLRLALLDHQVALLERDGDLQAVLPGGVHEVTPAKNDRLFFLHTHPPVSWRFDEQAVLWVNRRDIPVTGTCAVTVCRPSAFYRAFLRGVQTCETDHVQRVLDALVRSRIETRLDQVDPAAVQTILAHLCGGDLTDDLDPYGLACPRLAVSLREAPVMDSISQPTGHFIESRDNDR